MEMTLSNHLKGGGAEESLTKTKRRKRGGGGGRGGQLNINKKVMNAGL